MIGCGDVTERKSGPAYRLAEGSELTGVFTRRAEQARDYARRHGVPRVFDSAEALIRDPDIDAVYIATPPSSHAAYARMVAAAGKPCCVEKPMALTEAEARDMNAAFLTAGKPLFIAYYRRCLPRFEQVRNWLQGGCIGDVRQIHWTLTRPLDPHTIATNRPWRVDADEAPGGYFDDLAGHGLDLFDHWLGPIRHVAGYTANLAGQHQVPDTFSASWQHESGVTGTACWNFASFDRTDRVDITGSEGRIQTAIFDDAPLELETRNGLKTLDIAHPDPIQLPHVDAMITQLQGGQAHPSTGLSALRTARVCEAILTGDSAAKSS
ncbi:Gfo/Idh/MocA family protein [Maricaulis parjimensis]|uniref:Gfo/Idh/MocA family protein n=1 Tax=Maricaulis parjimensis TaxID=144023 RepID=UPI00193ACBA7|nr:Gfo/Idh/MocA family oxidoreductase [Maricaulis parjimensis]